MCYTEARFVCIYNCSLASIKLSRPKTDLASCALVKVYLEVMVQHYL